MVMPLFLRFQLDKMDQMYFIKTCLDHYVAKKSICACFTQTTWLLDDTTKSLLSQTAS